MTEEVEKLLPVAMLVDDLQSDDIITRINSIKKLSTIALALGVERTRSELIPYLADLATDEDEVLMELAEQLGYFVPLVGNAEYSVCLLQPLENLAAAEETVVRDKAILSIQKILPHFSMASLEKYYMPMVKRLAAGDWFHSRMSSCSLFHDAYPRIKDVTLRVELRSIFKQLCLDETPMVRRAASLHLPLLAASLETDAIKNEFLPVLNKLNQDEQDSVRMLAAEAIIGFCKLSCLNKEDQKTSIVPLLKTIAKDKSWRVRYVIADKICLFQQALGPEITKSTLVEIYEAYLRDQESEVKAISTSKLKLFCQELPPDSRQTIILNTFLPIVKELVLDINAQVKINLAAVVMSLSPLVGKDNTIEHLVPLFLSQLKDENSDVRLNIISNLYCVNEVIGMKSLNQNLLPAVVQLANDTKWRVRLAIIEHMPLLAGQLGQQFFDDKLVNLCLEWLNDNIFAIRQAAVLNVRHLTEKFGHEWAQNTVIVKIQQLATDRNYLRRLISLYTLEHLLEVFPVDISIKTLLPIILGLSTDPVANVRFKVAKILGNMGLKLDQTQVTQQMRVTLEKLSNDVDMDVVYFTKESMLKLKLMK